MKVLGFGKVGKVILVVIGLILLVAVVGWVGDMVSLRTLVSQSNGALQYFTEFKRTGYEKPAYYPDMKDGKAWDAYARIITLAESSDSADMRLINDVLLGGADDRRARAAEIISNCDSIIAYIKEGVRRKSVINPLDYEEGYKLHLPHYLPLRNGAKLMACRARLNARRNPQYAVEDMIDGAIFGQDLAGGDLTLIGHMVGVVCLGISARQMGDALSDFHLKKPQLERLARAMNTLAETWPPASRNLEGEYRLGAISLRGLRLREMEELEFPGPKTLSNAFFYWWYTHLLSWRQLFSFRRAQVGAIRLHMLMVKDLKEAEAKGYGAVDSVFKTWESRLIDSGNWLAREQPTFAKFHARRFEGMAKARLAGAGALVEIYFLKNRRWPDKLELVKRDDLLNLLIDPMSGERLKYIVYPGADSVAIYSVGINMVDDGGVEGEERKDRVLVLHRPKQY